MPNDVLALGLDGAVFLQHPGLARGQDAIKPAQDRKRENHLAILVALVRTAQEIADAPDENWRAGYGFQWSLDSRINQAARDWLRFHILELFDWYH